MAGRRTRGRGRSRKRAIEEKPPQENVQTASDYSISSLESSKDEDFVPSSAFSRYQKRQSRSILAQSAPLRKPVRSVKKTPFHSSSLNETRHEEPPSAGNRDDAMPESRKIEYVVSHGECIPEKSTAKNDNGNSKCLSRCHSINVTEFAKRLRDEIDDDPEEIESALDPRFDCVNGHNVKVEIAPLLRRIFEKYGDITSESNVKSPNNLSFILERLCGIYEKLERTKFLKVTHIELDEMFADVCDFELVKINVGWLRAKLEYISQTLTGYQEYASLKEEEGKYDASIGSQEKGLEACKRELCELQRKISLVQQKINTTEEELVVKRARADWVKKRILDIKSRVKTLDKQTLVHGLL